MYYVLLRSLQGCTGVGGFSDIQAGMPVIVQDEKNTILSTGTTETGYHPRERELSGRICIFKFTVKNIPVAKFYSIEVGRRGKLTYSFDEMVKKKWDVSFVLSS
jgi:hypothetical protein